MRGNIDLHLHTTCSDGNSTPEELLGLVGSKNLKAFAVTDHDTLEGYRAVARLLKEGDPELITGIELSVTIEDEELHLLGYVIDPDNQALARSVDEFRRLRSERGRAIVDKLNEIGVQITYDDVEKQANGGVTGRPHVAQALFHKKIINQYEEAFQKYIGRDGPAYVPKGHMSPQEAIDLIHNADGLAILAHPGIENKDRHIEMLAECGLDGIEAYHPAHRRSDVDRYRHFADRYRLIVTGGSDFHGQDGKLCSIGIPKVPYSCLENLKQRALSK